MEAEKLIRLVYTLIDEEDFNNDEVQPLKKKIYRYEALGKAFEDIVKIYNILNEK